VSASFGTPTDVSFDGYKGLGGGMVVHDGDVKRDVPLKTSTLNSLEHD